MNIVDQLILDALKERGRKLFDRWLLPQQHRRAWTVYRLDSNNSPYIIGTFGLLFNKHSLWMGAHYSAYNKRWCINLIPCCTLWITAPGGKTP